MKMVKSLHPSVLKPVKGRRPGTGGISPIEPIIGRYIPMIEGAGLGTETGG